MNERITIGTILARTFALLKSGAMPILVWLALLSLPSAAIVLNASARDAAQFEILMSVPGLFAQYQITFSLLARRGLLKPERVDGRAAAFIVTGIVTELAIALGVLLLILPGLYLLARWIIVTPLIIGENMGVGASMRESANRTRGHIGPILGALVVAALPMLVTDAIAFLPPEMLATLPVVPFAIVDSALGEFGAIAIWVCCVAIYSLSLPERGTPSV